MKRSLLAIWCFLLVSGCRLSYAPDESVESRGEAVPLQNPGTQASAGVQVHTPGLGGSAPVTGTESLQGGGSAVGQTLKDKARALSSNPPPSPDQSLE